MNENNTTTSSSVPAFVRWLMVLGLVYLILLAIGMIGDGFKWLSGGKEGAKELFAFATNPIMGLFVGMLATALVQSSSTVTSVIVGLCAGGLPVAMAIPMVMGANIGTTITNSIVSMGHARDKDEFKRAFCSATVHDFFNILAVTIFLPLELMFGLLEKLSHLIAHALVGGDSMSMHGMDFIKPITKPVVHFFKDILSSLPEPFGPLLLITLGIVLIFAAILFIGKQLRMLLVGRAKEIMHAAIGRGPVSGILSGTAATVLVQSSSTTTSLAVPLVGSGVFAVKQIYPFTLGANIGTTVTALLAATAASGPGAEFAMQIAVVHLLFNLLAVVTIYSIPFLRNIPLMAADQLSSAASEKKMVAISYILVVFFAIPGAIVGISSLFS